MKKLFLVLPLVFILTVTFLAFYSGLTGFSTLQGQPGKSIKIGAILALSGPLAYWGDYAKKGFSIALDDINDGNWFNHGKIELVLEDGQGSPKESVTAYNKIMTTNKIPAIITNFSSVGLAISPLANRDKIIQMDFSSTTPDYSSKGDFTFRTTAAGTFENNRAAEAARNILNAKTAAVIYVNNAFGVGAKNVFVKRFEELGGKVTIIEAFEQNSNDFRTQLLRIDDKAPDIVYFAANAEAAALVRQARELGIKSRLFGTQWMINAQFFAAVGNAADGILFVSTFSEKNSSKEFEQYMEKFEKRFGEEPSLADTQAYDALMLVAVAMSQCSDAHDTVCIRDRLFKVKGYSGASGIILFDENGDTTKLTILKIIQNGKATDFED